MKTILKFAAFATLAFLSSPSIAVTAPTGAVSQAVVSLTDGSWTFKAAVDQTKPAIVKLDGKNYYVFTKTGKVGFYLLDTVQRLVPADTSKTLTSPVSCTVTTGTRPQSLIRLSDGSYTLGISSCSTTALAGNVTIKLSNGLDYYFGKKASLVGSTLRDTIDGLVPSLALRNSYLLR